MISITSGIPLGVVSILLLIRVFWLREGKSVTKVVIYGISIKADGVSPHIGGVRKVFVMVITGG